MSVTGKLALSVLPALFVLGGVGMAYKTHQGRERADTVAGAERHDAASLEPGDGLVAVEGTARATGDDLVPATMAGTEGVVVRTVVEQRAAGAVGDKRKTDWDTIYADGNYVPFAVADDTGEAAVEPPDGDVSNVTVDTELYESEPGEEPPEPVRRWLAETDGIDAAVDQYRGYRQGVIEDGESVYGVGEPVAGDGGVVLTGGDRSEEFVVSDLSAEELAEETGYGLAGYVVGGLLLVVGLAPLALIWLG